MESQNNLLISQIDINKISTVICIIGNDGTGKTTLCENINSMNNYNIYCLQRSIKAYPKQLEPVLKQVKKLDQLTYFYSYEKQRKSFQLMRQIQIVDNQHEDNIMQNKNHKIKIFWFILDLQPQKIQQRLQSRSKIDIYDCKKAVEYYSYIYRQYAYYYGMILLNAENPQQTITDQILSYTNEESAYNQITSIQFNQINLNKIKQLQLEQLIYKQLKLENHSEKVKLLMQMARKQILLSQMNQFYLLSGEFQNIFGQEIGKCDQKSVQLKLRICSRLLMVNGVVQKVDNIDNLLVRLKSAQCQIKLILSSSSIHNIYLKTYQQGQSKILLSINSLHPKVHQYFSSKSIILLKSTIYSHTNQNTGQIPKLGQIRALGNILFLQMIRRNNLKHAYLSISEQGIILSQLVQTNSLQIVFKKQLLGTDKHSYIGMRNIEEIVNNNNNSNFYKNGVYIRIDWRNPNHILKDNPNLLLNQDKYYYVIQKSYGKQTFFNKFLSHSLIKSMGDKCVTTDILTQYIKIKKIKKLTLKLYTSFQYYSNKVGLQILDGCFMFDKYGEIGWSEINPDCMRVKSIVKKQDYDKDIWRYGGSSSKQKIFQKWTIFNQIFIQWFKQNRFHKTQLLQLPQLCYPYQQICRKILSSNSNISPQYKSYYHDLINVKKNKRLIGTIDISQNKPILVKSSQISQNHSTANLQKAFEYVSLLQDVVLVDIDAAIGNNSNAKNNRGQIGRIVKQNRQKILAVGGGIRNKQVLNYYLNQLKAQKIIISSNLQLLDYLTPQVIAQRVIVQLSINQKNQVLIKGRQQNTHIKLPVKIEQLICKNVKSISITFNKQQGHLRGIPRKQLIQLLYQIPYSIQTIIIAGGISSIEDLNFIWGFKRCIPQLGSAIWKNKISVSQIYSELVKFNDDGLLPAIIQDQYKNILGQVYLNQYALKLTCEQRKLYRYSRQYQKVMRKGNTSGNVYDVLDFKLDCDNDSIIIIVKGQNQQKQYHFCHKNQYSCFQTKLRKNDIQSLQAHIKQKSITGSGYSKRMIQNQGLTAMKLYEQLQQLTLSDSHKIDQASDLLAHLLIYLSSHKISTKSILKQLQRRSLDTIQININNKNHRQTQKQTSQYTIGILGGKHFQKIDQATINLIGLQIKRPQNRSAIINYQIKQNQLFNQIFQYKRVNLIGIKSKDMSVSMSKKIVQYCVNYSVMIQNYPLVCKLIKKILIPGIRLSLLGRKGQNIDPKLWTTQNKGIIVCEYPYSVNKYFNSLGIDQKYYTLIRVSGSTQSYLVSQNKKVDYCDAIIETGRTVQQNNLQIVYILQQTIYAGLYKAL